MKMRINQAEYTLGETIKALDLTLCSDSQTSVAELTNELAASVAKHSLDRLRRFS